MFDYAKASLFTQGVGNMMPNSGQAYFSTAGGPSAISGVHPPPLSVAGTLQDPRLTGIPEEFELIQKHKQDDEEAKKMILRDSRVAPRYATKRFNLSYIATLEMETDEAEKSKTLGLLRIAADHIKASLQEKNILHSWLTALYNNTLKGTSRESAENFIDDREDQWPKYLPKLWVTAQRTQGTLKTALGVLRKRVTQSNILYQHFDINPSKNTNKRSAKAIGGKIKFKSYSWTDKTENKRLKVLRSLKLTDITGHGNHIIWQTWEDTLEKVHPLAEVQKKNVLTHIARRLVSSNGATADIMDFFKKHFEINGLRHIVHTWEQPYSRLHHSDLFCRGILVDAVKKSEAFSEADHAFNVLKATLDQILRAFDQISQEYMHSFSGKPQVQYDTVFDKLAKTIAYSEADEEHPSSSHTDAAILERTLENVHATKLLPNQTKYEHQYEYTEGEKVGITLEPLFKKAQDAYNSVEKTLRNCTDQCAEVLRSTELSNHTRREVERGEQKCHELQRDITKKFPNCAQHIEKAIHDDPSKSDYRETEKTALHYLDSLNEAIRVTQESCHEIRLKVIAAKKEHVQKYARLPLQAKESRLKQLNEEKKQHHISHFLRQSGVHEHGDNTHSKIAETYGIDLKHPSRKWQSALAEILEIENTVTDEERRENPALEKLCNELHEWRVQHEKYVDNPAHFPSMRALHSVNSEISKAHYLIAKIAHHDVEKKASHLKKSVEASNKSIFYHALHHAEKEADIDSNLHAHNKVPERTQERWNRDTNNIDLLVQRLHESLALIGDVTPHSNIGEAKHEANQVLEDLTLVRSRMREYSKLFASDVALHSVENRNALKSRQSTLRKLAQDVSAKLKRVAEEEERRIKTENQAYNDIFREAMKNCDQMYKTIRFIKRSDESQKKIEGRMNSIIRRMRDPVAQKHAKDGRLPKIALDAQLNQLRVEHSGVDSQLKSLQAQLKTVQAALKRLKQQENLVAASNISLNHGENRIIAEEKNHYRKLATRVRHLEQQHSVLQQLVNFNIKIARTINMADKISETVFDSETDDKHLRKDLRQPNGWFERKTKVKGVQLPK